MPYGINETMGQYSELFMLLAAGTYTVASHSNLDKGGYATSTVDLSRFAGTTVTLRFRGTEDSSAATTFRIDEVAVTAR